MILLAIFDSSTRSTSKANYMIIAIILSLSWFLCFGSIFTFTKTLIKYRKKRTEKASRTNLESDNENISNRRNQQHGIYQQTTGNMSEAEVNVVCIDILTVVFCYDLFCYPL